MQRRARQDGLIEDYCDGEAYKEHPLFSKCTQALQLLFYYDDVEVVNPLIFIIILFIALFYFTLGNISPKYRSSLNAIQLVAVAKHSCINNNDCCGKGLIEIKCTYKYREELPVSDHALNYFLVKDPISETVKLSREHKYFYQVQGQLAVCDMSYCNFVCWTEKDTFIERISKDETFISRVFPTLTNFFCKYLLPELLTHQLADSTGTLTSSHHNKENQDVLFCFCRQPESGRMVACDNPTCKIVWFHFSCVKLKRAPSGKWYCSDCISQN